MKCDNCGGDTMKLIRCKSCNKLFCLSCFSLVFGSCFNCVAENYSNYYYKDVGVMQS